MNELEAFDKIKNECYWDDMPIVIFPKECVIVEKALKALEVLKKKNVNVKLVKTLESLEEYNNMHADSRSKFPELTQDEFTLLKEVL